MFWSYRRDININFKMWLPGKLSVLGELGQRPAVPHVMVHQVKTLTFTTCVKLTLTVTTWPIKCLGGAGQRLAAPHILVLQAGH